MGATSTTFKKGEKRPGQGKRGPSKTTVNARAAIALLVEGNLERMQSWLDSIAEEEGPLKAWQCMTDVIEYHIPKLARTEHVGDRGGPVRIIATPEDQAL